MKLVRKNNGEMPSPNGDAAPWHVLVADDDADVRALTRLNLKGFRFDGRPLALLEAASAAEAKQLLAEHDDIALALIDVVMESDDAGLRLVEHIRQERADPFIRLVIRTGQPGMAPERFVIDNFDIDDYKDKTELTSARLYTTVRSAIKSYRDLKTLEHNRAALSTLLAAREKDHQALEAALLSTERFRHALDNVPAYVYMKDAESRYTYANQPTLKLFGCDQTGLLGQADSQFFPTETATRLRQIDLKVLAGQDTTEEIEVNADTPARRVYWEVKTPVYKDLEKTEVIGICGISTDITALRDYQKQLEFNAHYDPLTGLANRVLLFDRIERAITQSARRGHAIALVYMDLDGFKQINDSLGHDAGDQLLIALARRMSDVLRQGDTLARIGGDEFVALLMDIPSPRDCDPILGRLLAAAASPVAIGTQTVQVSASLGVTLYPGDASDADLLLRHADQAMYQAKKSGKNRYRWYDTHTNQVL